MRGFAVDRNLMGVTCSAQLETSFRHVLDPLSTASEHTVTYCGHVGSLYFRLRNNVCGTWFAIL